MCNGKQVGSVRTGWPRARFKDAKGEGDAVGGV